MASFCCLSTTASTSKTLAIVSPSVGAGLRQSPSMSQSCSCSPVSAPLFGFNPLLTYNRRPQLHVVRMAPEEEKKTRRNPLDFPLEWERPKPARRPDILPQFSPMKTPLPTPLPADPPEEEEDEDEEKKEEEEEEDPEKEEKEEPAPPEELS